MIFYGMVLALLCLALSAHAKTQFSSVPSRNRSGAFTQVQKISKIGESYINTSCFVISQFTVSKELPWARYSKQKSLSTNFNPHFRRPRGSLIEVSSTLNNQDVDLSSLEDILQSTSNKMVKFVMTPQFFMSGEDDSASLRGFYKKMVKSVEIRDSSIEGAGRGLFATKNIKANTIISFYPAHVLGTEESLPESANDSPYIHCTDQALFGRPSFLQGLSDDPVFLDVDPAAPLIDGWHSHIINDGASVLDECSEAAVLKYYEQSTRARNCIHIPFGPSPIMATVTTKKVKAGQELFTTYGGLYWLSHLVQEGVCEVNNVGLTPAIQAQIQSTAKELRESIKKCVALYATELQAFHNAFDSID